MLPKPFLLSALLALLLAAPSPAAAKGRRAPAVVYPMKAAEFRQLTEARIDKVRDAVDKKLDRHGVSSDRKKAIHKTLDELAIDARAALDKATADGTVTQAEGDKVKSLVAEIRGKLKARLRKDNGGKPEAKRKAPSTGGGNEPVKGKTKGKATHTNGKTDSHV